jgi:hypoxanthine phosphoribosyltransferase
MRHFAHESEARFARILDFYGVPWEYEPVEFALGWDAAGRPTSAFRPDFWLPDPGLFVELTTLNQRLVTKKNGKVRRMGQLYPDVRVTILYQRDTLALLAKYGLADGTLAESRIA